MSEPGSNRQLSVSEQTLLLHLANFKLDLFKELTSTYATIAQLDRLADEIKAWRHTIEADVQVLKESRIDSEAEGRVKGRLVNAAWVLSCAVIGGLLYLISTGVH